MNLLRGVPPKLHNIYDVAAEVGYPWEYILRLAKKGIIPSVKTELGYYRFTDEGVEALRRIKNGQSAAPARPRAFGGYKEPEEPEDLPLPSSKKASDPTYFNKGSKEILDTWSASHGGLVNMAELSKFLVEQGLSVSTRQAAGALYTAAKRAGYLRVKPGLYKSGEVQSDV